MTPDLILYHGTCPLGRGIEAVAVRCGRIQAVGSDRQVLRLRGHGTELLDLSGRPLLPGFFDSHTHFLAAGLDLTFYIDLSQARCASEALALLSRAAQERPGGWVVGRGWDESTWPERRYLERADLDRAVPRAPACAVRVDGHLVVANTLALARCGRPDGELVDRERGHLWEEAAEELLSCALPDEPTLIQAVGAASKMAAELGITSVAEMGGQGLLPFQKAREKGLLCTRVFLYLSQEALEGLVSLGIGRGLGDELLRIQGVKLFVDGSIGARTAAVSQPYLDGEGKGNLLLPRRELARLLEAAKEAGLQAAIHAIGDVAIEEAISACELAGITPGHRFRIEHLELPSKKQLSRMAELGLVASMQPNFARRWSGPGGMYQARLGEERDAVIDPHAWALEAGLPLAFGSDCMPMGPLYGLPGALNPPHEHQRLPLEAALRAYSWGGAYATFSEGELGELAPGRWADLVVLSADPKEAPWEEIRVDMTFLAGRAVYQAR
ncbi:MAG: TIM-barrel fold metal-dependent hydrolase [Acetothermia bacterium 64_32]|nr:MAG: TIM-barrel fold metal-dependent hydrolase [Acetothermia bacterium 64_32]